MNNTVFLGLINNAALLLSLGLIYDHLANNGRRISPIPNQIATGLIIGGMTIVLMLTPVKWNSGIIFDTRTIVLGLSGLFFGTIPTLVAMVVSGAYRLNFGGVGASMGLATIASSGLIGLAWRYRRYRESQEFGAAELYVFGTVVHFGMILCIFLLPQAVIAETFRSLALPIIIVYPIATALLGMLIVGRQRRDRIGEEVLALKNTLHKANGELRKHQEDLLAQIEESETARRLQQASQEEIAKINVRLARSNEELDNFAYVASHDLKSPLRGIDQLATWIGEDLGDHLGPETMEHLRLIRSRIHRMEMLLDDLLAYSRVGRVDGEVTEVDTHTLIEEIYDLIAADKSMHLTISDDMPVLLTKRVPLELVFRNVIGNAVKHHDKEQGIINVSARRVADGVEFTIQDDGPGIPLEHQQRVFAMFQTLKPRDEIEGSGIGLSLVKKTVEGVGGKIFLESDGQLGCTFRFIWPTLIALTNPCLAQ